MTTSNTPDQNSTPPKSSKWSRRKIFTVVGVATVVAAGAFASAAQSEGGFFRHGFGQGHGHHAGFMSGDHDGSMRGKHAGSMRGEHSPENFEKHLDKKLGYFGLMFDATDEQQAKLKTVITDLMTEVRPLKDKMRETREELQTLLTQPTIDRAAIEKLRSEKIAMVDTISKKVTAAIADAGDVLDLKQRKKLVEFMNKYGPGHRGGWRRG